MSGLVSAVISKVRHSCQVGICNKDRCSVSLNSAPSTRVIVDMDCEEISKIQTGKICDYIFFGENKDAAWVVPIELKSGKFKSSHVVQQLQDGIKLAEDWIPPGCKFRLVPMLFRNKQTRVHRIEFANLRKARIKFRKRKFMIEVHGCGDTISESLNF